MSTEGMATLRHPSTLLLITVVLIVAVDDLTAQTSSPYYFCDDSQNGVIDLNVCSPPVIIRSSNVSTTYANNQRGSVAIRSGSQPLKIFLHMNYFDIEYHINCSHDWLCMNGVRFCGDWQAGRTSAYILPANSSFTLHFRSDDSVTRRGFEINVTTTVANNQTIEEITGGVGSNINLVTTNVKFQPDVPYTDRCAVPKMLELHPICGESEPNIVHINTTSPDFHIHSPNFGVGNYFDYLNCSITLMSGFEPLLLILTYNAFVVESQETCSWDYLCVHGVHFCGDWLGGHRFKYILPAHSPFTLVFISDYSEAAKGFEIHVSGAILTNEKVQEAIGGVGSDMTNVISTPSTFWSRQPYIDRCAPVATATTTGSMVQIN